MANEGTVCFLVDWQTSFDRDVSKEFEAFVSNHPFLRNLQVLCKHAVRKRLGGEAVSVYVAGVDRLVPKDVLDFFGGAVPGGVKAFVRDSAWNEDWKQV